jgi:nucleoside-diphosphate-sugar epimerase
MIEQTLVMGSTGFLGQQIARYLHEAYAGQGRSVTGMRRWNSDVEPLQSIDIPDVVADLDDERELERIMSGVNYLVYAAAPDTTMDPDEYRQAAVRWIRRVLRLARENDVQRVVITSTAATMDTSEDRPVTARDVYCPGDAEDPFVEAAYAVEQEAFRQAADGQDIVIINPSVVLAPGARLPAPSRLDVELRDPVSWVDGTTVAEAHRAALEKGRRGQRYAINERNADLETFYREARARPDVEVADAGPAFRNRDLLARGRHVDDSETRQQLAIGSE